MTAEGQRRAEMERGSAEARHDWAYTAHVARELPAVLFQGFGNAQRAITHRLCEVYCEGTVWQPDEEGRPTLPAHHAWNLHGGKIVDTSQWVWLQQIGLPPDAWGGMLYQPTLALSGSEYIRHPRVVAMFRRQRSGQPLLTDAEVGITEPRRPDHEHVQATLRELEEHAPLPDDELGSAIQTQATAAVRRRLMDSDEEDWEQEVREDAALFGPDAQSMEVAIAATEARKNAWSWAHGLRMSDSWCLGRVVGLRCRGGAGCAQHDLQRGRYQTVWNQNRRSVLYVSQPYSITDADRAELDALCQRYGLRWMLDESAAWHNPGRSLGVVVWNPSLYDYQPKAAW
jgi:hypothetical protein